MQKDEVFATLGIEETKDERALKNAYRQQLKNTNPEDDPEGFKRLREAYEAACEYARSDEEQPKEEKKADHTPSGEWIHRAEELYGRFSLRCDEKQWKELFQDDTYVSLDTNEECQKKLLIFLMNHFNYPDTVWKVISGELHIQENAGKLREQFPADFVDFLIRRCMTKEVIDYTLFEGADDADYDSFIRCYNTSWDCLHRKDYQKVDELLQQTDDMGIAHPYMELVRATAYRDSGRQQQAQTIFEKLREQYPDDMTILYQLAEFYYDTRQADQAINCFRILKEQDRHHYMANYRLAFLYADQSRYEDAKECIRMVMRRGQDDKIMNLRIRVNHQLEQDYRRKWQQNKDIEAAKELAWCLLQEDRYLAADKLTQEMADLIPSEMRAEYLGLCARIYMAQGLFDKTLETARQWQKLLLAQTVPQKEDELEEYNRNIEIVHRIQMTTYHMMGRAYPKYYANALEEFEFYRQQENINPNALIDAARIYMEMEEYDKSLRLADEILNRYQIQYAYALMLEVYVKLWDAGNVIRCGMQCIKAFPEFERPYEEIARVYYDLKQKDKLKEILDLASKNQVHSAYLDAYAYTGEEKTKDYPIGQYLDEFKRDYSRKLTETGQISFYTEGYPVITKYLNLYPCNYILNTRGLFSMAAKEYEQALKDFRKILERDPADQFAYNNIGCVLKYQGQYELALPYFEKALYYMYRTGKEEPNAMPLGNMAHTYELMGEYALAAQTYQKLIDTFSEQQESFTSMKDISANYARSNQVGKAVNVLNTYMSRHSEYFKLIYRMYVYAADWEKADKAHESMYRHLKSQSVNNGRAIQELECEHMWAWQLMRQGKWTQALNAFRDIFHIKAKKNVRMPAKMYTDLCANELFLLALMKSQESAAAKPTVKKEKTLLEKIRGIFVKEKKSVQQQDAFSYEEEGRNCAKRLEDYLQNPIGDFFYKERYVRYLEYMVALYTKDLQASAQALERLEKSERCRLCNHAECMRCSLAGALQKAYEGDMEQAHGIFGELLARQPYNLYALCGTHIGEERKQ